MAGAPWFAFYARQWLIDTEHLDLDAEGAYARLLSHQWEQGGLPCEPDMLRRLAKRPQARTWDRIWLQLECFFPLRADGMRGNVRLEIERERLAEQSDKQRARASSRWEKVRTTAPQQSTPPTTSPNFAGGDVQTVLPMSGSNPAKPQSPVNATAHPRQSDTRYEIEDQSNRSTPDGVDRSPAKARTLALLSKHASAATQTLALLNDARRRVVPDARDLTPTVGNLRWIAERLEEGHTLDDMRHVVAVREAEVRRNPSAGCWFNAITPFRTDQFARALGTTERMAGVQQPQATKPAASRGRGVAQAATWTDSGGDL